MTILQRWRGFLALLAFAVLVLFFRLGEVPHGMTWDEAAIGYNGYAVITTRRDEWLQRLPVSFKSFGDYKSSLAIYVTGVFVTVLGSELWVVRLPFALMGLWSVVGMVFLMQSIMVAADLVRPKNWQDQLQGNWSLLAGGLFVTSPWFLHFARTGFEAGFALTGLIWGSWAALQLGLGDRGLAARFSRMTRFWQVILLSTMMMGWVAALYAYHSAKVVVPLLALLMGIWQFAWWRKQFLLILVVGGIGLALSWPLLQDTFLSSGGQRFSQTSYLGQGLPPLAVAQRLIANFGAHLDPLFLAGGLTDNLRHGDGVWGVVLWPVVALLLLSIITLSSPTVTYKKWVWLALGWVLIGLLPAALAVDVPRSNRSQLALPGIIMLATLGWYTLHTWLKRLDIDKRALGTHGERGLISKSVGGTIVLVYCLLFIAYQHHYYTDFAAKSSADYIDGYLEVMHIARDFEKGKRGDVPQQIIVSSRYQQPYIYALFVRRTNPIWYQGGSLNRYLFLSEVKQADLARDNTLVIATPLDDVPSDQADEVVHGSDGQPRFLIYYPQRWYAE